MNHRRKLLMALGPGALATGIARSFAARAQGSSAAARIGFIAPNSAAATVTRLAAFNQGMRENGLAEGKHYVLDVAYADGQQARFPALAKELLLRNPAIVLSSSVPALRFVRQTNSTVPIVMIAVNDPVASGMVASLARPGGNTTGLSTQAVDVMPKYVEFLREALPRAKRIAVLFNPGNPANQTLLEQLRSTAGRFGIELRAVEVATPSDIDTGLGTVAKHRPDALVVVRDAMLIGQADRISALSLKSRIPTFGPISEFVDAGSLLSYAPSNLDMWRHSATYVRKILSGTKPADLPVEQPTRFELVLNLRTAKALGITMPYALMVRADRVIE